MDPVRARACPTDPANEIPDVSVPSSLRAWFVVHFLADVAAALPLFVAPHAVLARLPLFESRGRTRRHNARRRGTTP